MTNLRLDFTMIGHDTILGLVERYYEHSMFLEHRKEMDVLWLLRGAVFEHLDFRDRDLYVRVRRVVYRLMKHHLEQIQAYIYTDLRGNCDNCHQNCFNIKFSEEEKDRELCCDCRGVTLVSEECEICEVREDDE